MDRCAIAHEDLFRKRLSVNAKRYWEIDVSLLRYVSIICVALAVTVCEAEIAIDAPAPGGVAEGPSTSDPTTPEPGALKVSPLRLAIDLVDGSHIIGVPSITSVPVRTSYASVEIPLKQIQSITIRNDHEDASFELQNGDKLGGVPGLALLELETVFGRIAVDVQHIAVVRIITGTLPARGLVLHYSFDREEGNKVTDRTGKENDGVVHGATWEARGKMAGAYRFDGVDDYIRTKASAVLAVSDEMTILVWVKPNDLSGKRNNTILTRNFGGGEQYGMRFSGSTMYAQVSDTDRTFSRQNFGSFSENQWTHLAVTYSKKAGQGFIHVNGRVEGSNALVEQPRQPVSGDLYIGRDNRGSVETHFNGMIDEVMIFDRALSDSEIKMIYNSQK